MVTQAINGETRPSVISAKDWIDLSWTGLVWKRVSPMDGMTGGSQHPLFCVFGHYWHGDEQTNKQTKNRLILVQACSWPVRRQSFAIWVAKIYIGHINYVNKQNVHSVPLCECLRLFKTWSSIYLQTMLASASFRPNLWISFSSRRSHSFFSPIGRLLIDLWYHLHPVS